jgi:hypothetical protein
MKTVGWLSGSGQALIEAMLWLFLLACVVSGASRLFLAEYRNYRTVLTSSPLYGSLRGGTAGNH